MRSAPAAARQAAGRLPARRGGSRRLLGAGAGLFGGEGLAACLHPALGEVLAAADVIVPLAVALILLAAILWGSDRTCDRVFRLLRWLDGRPEPPAPSPAGQDHPARRSPLTG
jgi:hypothetical protein